MAMQLRPYQQEAIEAFYHSLRTTDGNPLLVLPTGAGKSAVVATICRDAVGWGGRVLVLTHVRELVEQLADTMDRVFDAPLGRAPVGVFSAGLNRRETDEPVIVAGIQSVYKRGADLGRFDIVLIDEAHLIPRDGSGMYRTLFAALQLANPGLRIAGLTATPFRTDSGLLYGDAEALFTGVCYEARVRDLIDQGFLSNLRGKNGGTPDLSAVHVRAGEFKADELEVELTDPEKIQKAVAETLKHGADRKSWLVFCCGVKHATLALAALRLAGVQAELVVGETPSDERDAHIARFKARDLRCLVSVGVLTTGFDAPGVDLIVLLRPTLSAGLYYQMVGRGLRRELGKANCMILDLAGNIGRHGPIDRIVAEAGEQGAKGDGEAPAKDCPQCAEILHCSVRVCPVCQFVFPIALAKHETVATEQPPLVECEEEWVDVLRAEWSLHTKKGAGPEVPKTLRVSYGYGYQRLISEWVCFEHSGFARRKAEDWWERFTCQPGHTAPLRSLEALDALDALAKQRRTFAPVRLLLRIGEKWPEIIGREECPRDRTVDEDVVYTALPGAADDSDEAPF